MSARIYFDGLDTLKAAFLALPGEQKSEATTVVLDAAHGARAAIEAAYPLGPPGRLRKGEPITSGNLKKGAKVIVKEIGPYGVAAQVRSTAHHAWLFEHGSQARHYVTKNGVRKSVGAMPPHPVLIPTMVRSRKAMYVRLADVVITAHGLTAVWG
jgi:hypothetical protein